MDVFTILIAETVSRVCIYMSQLTKLYALNIYCLLYVNYTLTKLFQNKTKHNKNNFKKHKEVCQTTR